MLEVFLLMLIGSVFLRIFKYLKKSTLNDVAKLTRVSKDGTTYVDNNGKIRLMSNDHLVAFENYKGNEILRDLKTYDIVKNYTQDKKEAERKVSLKKATEEGKKIYCVDFNNHKYDKIRGMRYQNMETGDIYVIRQIGRYRIPFYMDFEGKLVGLVDEKNWKYHQMINKDVDVDIDEELRKHNECYKNQPLWNKTLNNLWHESLDLTYCGRRFGE